MNMRPKALKACLFDLDGTILDSEPVYFESDRAFLARFGIDYDDDFNRHMVGRGVGEMFRVIEDRWPDSPINAVPWAERVLLKDRHYLDYARGRTRAFPAVVRLLDALAVRGVPVAVASGSSPDVIDETLRHAGLRERFPVVVSASEVPRGKPEPDVFLEAARRVGVAPEDCLVFEDSRYGVLAAKAAGMACVGVPDPRHGPAAPEFARADMVFADGPETLDPALVMETFF